MRNDFMENSNIVSRNSVLWNKKWKMLYVFTRVECGISNFVALKHYGFHFFMNRFLFEEN